MQALIVDKHSSLFVMIVVDKEKSFIRLAAKNPVLMQNCFFSVCAAIKTFLSLIV
jgi:hypothetical protein